MTHRARNLLGSALGIAWLHPKSSQWPRRLRITTTAVLFHLSLVFFFCDSHSSLLSQQGKSSSALGPLLWLSSGTPFLCHLCPLPSTLVQMSAVSLQTVTVSLPFYPPELLSLVSTLLFKSLIFHVHTTRGEVCLVPAPAHNRCSANSGRIRKRRKEKTGTVREERSVSVCP